MGCLIEMILYDSIPVHTGQKQFTFLQDTDNNDSSVTEKQEDDCIKFLFKNASWFNLLRNQLQLPRGSVAINFIEEPFYDPGRGEMDIILSNENSPHQSILIEAKRVKVKFDQNQNLNRNGLNNLFKGAHQIQERAREFQFWKNYLMIIILADGRELRNLAQWNRSGINYIIQESLFNDVIEDLHNSIGVILALLVQSSGKSIELQGTIGVGVWRIAQEQQQLDSTTNKVIRIINKLKNKIAQ